MAKYSYCLEEEENKDPVTKPMKFSSPEIVTPTFLDAQS